MAYYNNHYNVSLMNNLTANTEYTVTVVAFNELGYRDGEYVTRTGRTRPEGLATHFIISLYAPTLDLFTKYNIYYK